MGSPWVAVVRVSPGVRAKVAGRHGLDVDDVLAAVIAVAGLEYRWDDHPERGRRILIEVPYGAITVRVVLYPTADPDVWNLGSAYVVRS